MNPSVSVVLLASEASERNRLSEVLSQSVDLQLVGTAVTLEEAVRLVVLHQTQVTVVVLSSDESSDYRRIIRTLRAAHTAVLLLTKIPAALGKLPPNVAAASTKTDANVTLSWHIRRLNGAMNENEKNALPLTTSQLRAIVIGSSTGGPQAVQLILKSLPPDYHLPIVITQHIATGFVESFATWLKATVNIPIHIARHGETLCSGVSIAQNGRHLAIRKNRIALLDTPPRHGHRPAIDITFESAASSLGAGVVGIQLTGMGSDGAQGLAAIKQAGGMTIVQEPTSAIVPSMPTSALALIKPDHILEPERIGLLLATLMETRKVL